MSDDRHQEDTSSEPAGGTSTAGTSADASTDVPWWRRAVIYEVYPRSFADGNGDGEGDLAGLRARLRYLADLGVDGIWIAPWYPSPLADGGYDVSDFTDIHPMFGTLTDADAVLREARNLGLRVIIDVVPNHTSNEHPWFEAALAAGPGSRERSFYIFRDGKSENGDEPPNNWISCFGPEVEGSGWERVIEPDGKPGQWYLHTFAVGATRPRMAEPGRTESVRRHPAILVRPRGGRHPGGCRARDRRRSPISAMPTMAETSAS